MYHQVESSFLLPEKFEFPNAGRLSEDNRWVILAKLIPWFEFEEKYAENFSEDLGAPAKSFRMALGTLIIKEKLGTSDRETVEQIRENPYLQYFLGLKTYTNKAPFDPSMLVHFRERIGVELVNSINKQIVKEILSKEDVESELESKKEEINDIKIAALEGRRQKAEGRRPNRRGIKPPLFVDHQNYKFGGGIEPNW